MTRITIAILIDALGWEITGEYGFCRNLLDVSTGLDTVLGYSSAAIPSLLTGKVPSEHGVWSMYMYDPKRSPFRFLRYLRGLPSPLARRLKYLVKRYIDQKGIVRGYFDFYEIPLELLGYFDLSHKKDPYSRGGFRVETIFDVLAAQGARFRVWDYRTPEKDNFEALISAIDRSNDFLFLYTAELDAIMHNAGIFDERVKRKLEQYEEYFEKILDKASEAFDEVLLYVFSDHGMTEVDSTVDIQSRVQESGLKMKEDYMAFYDSTMARFWGGDEAKHKLKGILDSIGAGRTMTKGELLELGCYFEDQSYGEMIFLMDPGVMIVPSFMGREKLKAMHGYHPRDPFSKACFLTNDAGHPLPGTILDMKEFLLGKIGEAGK